jgi:hypothetical protein
VEPEQNGVGEVGLGSISQEARHRLLGQRADGHPLEGYRPRLAQTERVAAGANPQRDQDPDRRIRQAADHERQHPGRGHVQPLDVVDRDDHRAGRGQRAQHPQRRDRHGSLVRGSALDLGSEERRVQGALLRGGEVGQLEVEQVTKCRVGESGLRFRGAAGQHPMSPCPGDGDARVPQGRLADPGRSLKEQGRGSPRYRLKEVVQLGEFGVPPEDPVNRLVHPTPPHASAPILWGEWPT